MKLEASEDQFQCIVHILPHRLWIDIVKVFWESTNGNSNLCLGTGMGFSYFVHLIIKPKTWQFWVIIVWLLRKLCGNSANQSCPNGIKKLKTCGLKFNMKWLWNILQIVNLVWWMRFRKRIISPDAQWGQHNYYKSKLLMWHYRLHC